MIRGGVNPRLEPQFTITLLDPADNPFPLVVVLDTGFAGLLALPPAVTTHLALPVLGNMPIELADGSTVYRPWYEAGVEWQGGVRTVRAVEMATIPLVGINFLWGHRVTIDVVVGGDVTIQPIP